MSQYLLFRILSVFFTIALAALIPTTNNVWKNFIYSFGLSHYLLAFYYGRHQMARVFRQPHSRVPLAAVASAGAALYFFRFPLSFFFAPHQVYEETYLPAKSIHPDKKPALTPLLASTTALIFFVYFFVLRNYSSIKAIPPSLSLAGILISCAFFFYHLRRLSPSLSSQERVSCSAPVLVGLPVAALSLAVPIVFLQVVCYHFVFWALYFIPNLLKNKRPVESKAALFKYALLTVGILGLAFFVSPAGWSPVRFSEFI
ncbi:MAG: hypothetical protein ACREH5_00985, partial [Candidatus Omnitrophota bacterium]